ncbi:MULTISPECIES: 3-hydroxyacyl-ACP dehydratase FabZ [Rickettsieae]|uniref:3-hydroxyacyl-ACP dehydratase FabZ n=1 Tax=Rickettsieae TaxID=33988 RepID=UPI000B9A62C1|nr:3-hydroxyacyl-ACP dehydratase FabZ [Rickettsia endosymbiont of Culicoides newsteadi]MDN3029933.1 3-hydroxyacyl-ACP dehydratase FabZ [Candidatus Tisiphia sp.]OZG31759.1 beta-hydroxyacyl-ACP dehydratase [Rickettsia endosymbiont of Culicoides newsteadi]
MKINIIEIMEMLPHRYPFLLIDRVLEFKLNESIVGIKNVTVNEPQFTGHFPTKPIMPGVLIVEAMAQLSAILVAKSMNYSIKDKEFFFMSIEETKFRKIVEPGDTLHIYAKIEQNRGSVWKFSSNAKVDEQIVAESKFTAMVKNRN